MMKFADRINLPAIFRAVGQTSRVKPVDFAAAVKDR